MKRSSMRKNLTRTIRKSLGRYLAIVMIIALGCGIFVGLRVTKTDMVATGQKYTDEQNMFDVRLLNTYGWTQKDVDAISQMEGVAQAEGSVTLDVFGSLDGSDEAIYRLYSVPQTVNRVYLLGGRMPQSEDECLVDGAHADDTVLGKTFQISASNDGDTLGSLRVRTFKVVGYISTPLYMDMSRGSTSLGSGKLSTYVYIPHAAFDVDYFTEINVTIPGDFQVYSQAHSDAMDAMADILKVAAGPLADERFADVRKQAEEEYADGLQEYEDSLAEYEKEKADALQKLEDALRELQDAQAELDANRQTLADGRAQIEDAGKLLEENADKLAQSRVELEKSKAQTYEQLSQTNLELLENHKTVTESMQAVDDGLKQIEDGLAQLNSGMAQIDDGIFQIDEGLPQLELMIGLLESTVSSTQTMLELEKNSPIPNENRIARLEAQLAEQIAQRDGYVSQRQELMDTRAGLMLQLRELEAQKTQLEAQKAELEANRAALTDALAAIDDGFTQLESGKLQADAQFAAAEAQLSAGELELENARKELESKRAQLEEGEKALADGQAELDKGWAEYDSGKRETDEKLADADRELADAVEKLADARQTIDDMTEPDIFALTRSTNAGYMALDSNSDIVSGISQVFPAFFLLIAALVCITTMTRMVNEERTQIGTLKALGHSGSAIMMKYLFYTGSAALVGCGLGVVVGSVVFPMILWDAYSIIFNITPRVELEFDWPLCIAVVAAYTAVSLLVTWYCCRRTLKEVPAELIRPKAPTSGKKIFLEHLPFWDKLGFLNKVMLRNIFRYRQRLLMMLVGIGGCTALLLTGFGIQDSIVNIVDYQYGEVAVYDMDVYFSEGLTEQEQETFRRELEADVQNVGFLYQSSVELQFDSRAWDVYLMVADGSVKDYIDFHTGDTPLDMPGAGEAFVSVGVAEALGIRVGDTVEARDTDMRSLTLTVAGIYDNHVSNYLLVTPETVRTQWTEAPAPQTAFLKVKDGVDLHQVSAEVSKLEGVMNVTVSEDQAQTVNSMMDALISVVITIVICAGLLAAIVLYNLTNININERIREIATIKVLGFNGGETAAYVFKENILLSVMGAALGLLGGNWLLEFVMSQIKIDMVWFQARLMPLSYLYAVALTLLCAAIVDVVFYRKLEKINMAEALKSVE